MFVPGNANQFFSKTPAESSHPEPDLHFGETETATQTEADLSWEKCTINYSKESGFFKGLLLALPVSTLMWVAIIWGIKALIF